MPIKKFKDRYRPQRAGRIHLGVKKTKHVEGKGAVEYPSEVNFFVLKDCPELVKAYGPDPEDLRNLEGTHQLLHVTLPSARFDREFDEYLEKVFPQYYKRYRQSGLFCKGDGEIANCVNTETGAIEEVECPCDLLKKGECKQIGILRLRIQEIPSFNVYQITTSSTNAILNINSFIRDLLEHCYVNDIDPSSVKLELRREPQVVQRLENGKPKKSKHFIMVLDLDKRSYESLDDVATKALPPQKEEKALPPPDEKKDELFYPDSKAAEIAREEEEAEKAREEAENEAETPIEQEDEQSSAEQEEERPPDEENKRKSFKEAKEELENLMEEYVTDWGGEISLETAEKVGKFTTLEQVGIEQDRLKARIERKKAEKKRKTGKKEYAGSDGNIPF